MPHPFSSTMRSLERRRAPWSTALLLTGVAVAAAWTAWFVGGDVTLYETSDALRLEVDSAVHPVAAPVAGRVARSHLALGRRVRPGDVLVELDAEAERLAVAALDAELRDVAAQIAALEAELRAERAVLQVQVAAREAAVSVSLAQGREARARARLAEEEHTRLAQLQQSGGITQLELERLRGEATARRAAADAADANADALAGDRVVEERERQARLAQLDRSLVALRGRAGTGAARQRSLRLAIEQRVVRAPTGGRIGGVADVEVGTVVSVGARLGAIVPDGEIRAVAHFPAHALGRVRVDQPARIRLAGFPWTEYGTLPARVVRVASEPGGGRFRVELGLERSAAGTTPPVEHGLPGSVAVQVERTSPAFLLLRSIGRIGHDVPRAATIAQPRHP